MRTTGVSSVLRVSLKYFMVVLVVGLRNSGELSAFRHFLAIATFFLFTSVTSLFVRDCEQFSQVLTQQLKLSGGEQSLRLRFRYKFPAIRKQAQKEFNVICSAGI